jgi:solute:Na+ symporter, SSS family
VFYLFNTPPMLFNRVYDGQVAASPHGAEYASLQQSFDDAVVARRQAALRADRGAFVASDARVKDIRTQASGLVRSATGDDSYSDVNYVFPTFITTQMPIGLVGLMIAAIFAAAMSASGGELNALATASVIDFYRRHFVKDATDAHYVIVSKLATCGWGLFACFVAMRAANQGSLIEVVNRYGSVVYGSLLGVFILAILTKRATARGAFWGTIAGMAAVLYVYNWMPWIAFLWHNLIGAVVVVIVGMAISYTQRPEAAVVPVHER